jgi:predicted MFS family arabinose efflux permease
MLERVMSKSDVYKGYVLALLVLVMAFNFMDRYALGLVLQNIKTDLRLTDTQLGLLTGIAFALFYSVMGIPIARWADRGNRVTIISLTTALWSVAVALSGLAASFIQLMLVRIGVAFGGAGGYVPAFSMLADYFERSERPRAVAIYGLGSPLSIVGGYWLAGWLNELYGWRVMFLLLAAPGLLLAAVVRLTLREPRESLGSTPSDRLSPTGTGQSELSLWNVGRTLFVNATFRHLLLCMSVLFFFICGILQWQPTFFIRSYGLTSAKIGAWFALLYGVGGGLGSYLGGELASRYAANQERVQLVAIAIAMVVCGLLQSCVYLIPNLHLSLGLLAAVALVQTAINGPLYATLQTVLPGRIRAVSIALVLFFANLIGLGLGPLAVGMLSDVLRPWAGAESLRYALAMLAPCILWAAWHSWRASRTVEQDLTSTDAGHTGISPAALASSSIAH